MKLLQNLFPKLRSDTGASGNRNRVPSSSPSNGPDVLTQIRELSGRITNPKPGRDASQLIRTVSEQFSEPVALTTVIKTFQALQDIDDSLNALILSTTSEAVKKQYLAQYQHWANLAITDSESFRTSPFASREVSTDLSMEQRKIA